MTDKITKELLKQWNACQDGYDRFNELFPDGTDLQTAINGLIVDNNDDWAKWLFNRCKESNLFPEIIQKGYRNSGDRNSGNYNSGNRNSGYYNSGDCNSGYYNSGDRNSGYRNSGDYNSGDRNSGYYNSGDCNSGYYNSGDRNSGDRNSGNCNSGNHNSGNYNSGDHNSGYFNANTPKVRIFNKESNLEFNSDIIVELNHLLYYKIDIILVWIYSESMTDEEKLDNPSHITTGGYLKKQDYKYCWQKSWNKNFTQEDKQFIKSLPNFDATIFEEITGIDITKD